MSDFNRANVRLFMRTILSDHEDPMTGEHNFTSLVEAAAERFNQDYKGGCLDDPDYWIGKLYPIADLGLVPSFIGSKNLPKDWHNKICAVWTGEKRCPKKGEWFLSGAHVEAYYTSNDLSTVYHIAKLGLIETQIIHNIVKVF